MNSKSARTGSVLLSAVLLFLACACSQDDDGQLGRVLDSEEGASPVELLAVPGAPAGSLVVEGLVDARNYIEVSFDRSGVIAELGASIGDKVRRGQFLGLLESEGLREKLGSAREQRNAARRSLPTARLSRDGPPPAYLERAARLRQGQVSSSVSKQDADLRRLRRAVETGGQEEATRVALSILQQRNRKPSTRTADRVAADRLTQRLYDDLVDKVSNLEDVIEASQLVSPADGVVVEVNAFVGDTWNPRNRAATFRLMDARRLVVWVLVAEKSAAAAVLGMEVFARLPSEDGVGSGPVVRARIGRVPGVQVESVRKDGEIELLRQVQVELPAKLPAWVEVGDEALVAFPR